ncbi:MAG: DUF5677 domain-containing protein [Candidatus Sulfotelmatobacter sp.]|jgi:uncharacterized protein DUF5677
MEQISDIPVVFTPGNEPYLGRELLRAFDELIVCCLEHNQTIARRTRAVASKTVLQEAACILIPQGVSLALSIRELVRQGYLLGAKVLMRPLVERSVTMLYLQQNPSDLGIWERGWSFNERPGLTKMLRTLASQGGHPDVARQMTAELNSLTHGDPASSYHNLAFTDQGAAGHAVSKNLGRPDVCDAICAEAIPWLSVLLGMMHATFPAPEPRDVVH